MNPIFERIIYIYTHTYVYLHIQTNTHTYVYLHIKNEYTHIRNFVYTNSK